MASISTYSEWVTTLDRFGNGDDTALELIKTGYFVIDSGTAQRFYTIVEHAYKKRKQIWLDNFQRSLQLQKGRLEDLEIALRNGKQNLLILMRFVSLECLPQDLKKTLQKDLNDFIEEIKKSIKSKVTTTNSLREKMIVLLNSFSLPKIQQEELENKSSTLKKEELNLFSPKGRKIIF